MSAVVIVETVRRHLSSGAYIVYLILVALTGVFAATFNKPAAMWPSLVTLLAIIAGSALIGPEFSSATLQLIVSKPIHRWTYLLSRVAGVFASVALATIVAVSAEMGMRASPSHGGGQRFESASAYQRNPLAAGADVHRISCRSEHDWTHCVSTAPRSATLKARSLPHCGPLARAPSCNRNCSAAAAFSHHRSAFTPITRSHRASNSSPKSMARM